MTKFIVGMGGLVILLGGVVYYLQTQAPAAAPAQVEQVQVPVQAATSTYATSTFSVVYPKAFNLDPNFVNTEVSDKKPIDGVKFTIPESMATGTNLGVDSFVSIESLPNAKHCTGDIYLKQNVRATSFVDGTVQYSLATTSDAAAGNVYEEYVYALEGSSPCIAVRYFIHSTDITAYDPGAVRLFDRMAVLGAFDDIRHSLVVGGVPTQVSPTTENTSVAPPISTP